MIRNKRLLRIISTTVSVALLNQIIMPFVARALTSGPSQPETQQFTPIGTSDYVDLFTGDFTYNIPLLDVEGFPINLAYHSGITADQEASWVGLGWNINTGTINREVRGIPDDFNGDITTEYQNVRPNITVGIRAGISGGEIVGWPLENDDATSSDSGKLSLGISAGVSYNNYTKLGIDYGISVSAGGLNSASFDLQNSSQGGVTVSPSLSLRVSDSKNQFLGISGGINSREGFQDITLNFPAFTKEHNLVSNTYSYTDGPSRSFSFSKPVFYPSSEFPRQNLSFSFTLKPIGLELFAFFPNTTFTGYYYSEGLKTNTQSIPSYGWLYEDQSVGNDNALLDFDREKDVPFRQSSVNLPIPSASFDIFDVNANDLSGSYHLVRNDLGILHDRHVEHTGTNASAGFDFGLASVSHVGANVNVVSSVTHNNEWIDNNAFRSKAAFKRPDSASLYESAYFKDAGEMTLNQDSLYRRLGKTDPATVSLEKYGSTVSALNQLTDPTSGNIPVGSPIANSNSRIKRQQVMTYLTAAEATTFGLDKYIHNHILNDNPYVNCSGVHDTLISRLRYPAHHISEITIIKNDGRRYVYGLPAYNTYQKEITFNVSSDSVNKKDNLVACSGIDTISSNPHGKDHYVDSKKIPPYAYSYLLTAILSPDYRDNTGDGITDDDLGQAYKLNYSRVQSNFRWRTPVQKDSAKYMQGLRSVSSDDKGSYVYGTKEIWYVNSIESRNYIAVFYLLDREDGLGVKSESGGVDTLHKLKKLDHIDLYSKADLLKNSATAVPIKSVHFDYCYTLCPYVPNQAHYGDGKLTLKDIYFTYGKSVRGKLNKYIFSYDDSSTYSNPRYSLVNNDRWGNYSVYKGTYAQFSRGDTLNFPYTIQDTARANLLSEAWELKQIKLPSSGIISIKYESDSYAYVQDKRAGQMIKIRGFGSDSTSFNNSLYSHTGTIYPNNNYVLINLPTAVHSYEEFKELYLEDIGYLYYQFLVDVNAPPLSSDTSYEFVKGYATWISAGVSHTEIASSGSTRTAYLQLSPVSEDVLGQVNPVTYAAWQMLRLNLPEKAYPGSDLSDNAQPLDYVWSALSILTNLSDLIFGFNHVAQFNGKGRYVDTAQSYIRLDNPTFNKLGGGSRVKEITLSDNWSSMDPHGEASYSYGQIYNYTKEENGRTISSGVASYEPIIGNEENLFRQPVFYEEKIAGAPNNLYYAEEPLGESLFPAPVVGYSQVTVKNLPHTNVTGTGPGYSISKFYTARDYPVIYSHTDLIPELVKPNPIFKILNINVFKSMTASQGFNVEVNDMHGKLMEESIYNENGALISSKQYHYKNDDDGASKKHLNNMCKRAFPDGSIDSANIGVDFEAYADTRDEETDVDGGGVQFNTDVVYLFFGIIPIPAVYPKIQSSQSIFQSIAMTKLIKRYGILDKITAIENGAKVTTENLLYDSETGNPVLSKVDNEFSDPIYKFNYPDHWIFPRMGLAYTNVGATFKNVTFSNGVISIASPDSYFLPGDEIAVFTRSLQSLAFGAPVIYVAKPSTSLRFYAQDGSLFNLSSSSVIKIIRSGNRNITNQFAGSVSTLLPPINSTGNAINITSTKKILNADATQFGETWKTQKKLVRLQCDSIAPPDTVCEKMIFDSLLNRNHFYWPHRQFHLPCSSWTANGFGNTVLGINTSFNQIAPFQLESTSQWIYGNVGEFYNFEAISSFSVSIGKCNLYFVDTVKEGPLALPPGPEELYTYYTFVKPSPGEISSYIPNAFDVIYSGPKAWYLAPETRPECVGYVYFKCTDCENQCITLATNDTINPYVLDMLGVWRSQKTFAYNDLRNRAVNQFAPSVENDGPYATFSPIYTYNSSTHQWNIDSTTGNWVRSNESTIYDIHSNEIESKDALNIRSSALYTYNHTLPVSVIHNAQLNQAANDNFEDYKFNLSCGGNMCDSHHWDFYDVGSNLVVDSEAHTGNYSLRLASSGTSSVEETKTFVSLGSSIYTTTGSNQYKLGDAGLIPEFSPTPGKYILSAWVKVDTSCNCKSYWGNLITITMVGSGTVYNLKPFGPVIEGWQRIQQEFTIGSSDTGIKVKLSSNPHNATFFDDIRIFPSQGNMKSFVYDERTLRLMATLDENNYATFYEYDEEGNLIRIKKETERGIVSVQEDRNSLRHVRY